MDDYTKLKDLKEDVYFLGGGNWIIVGIFATVALVILGFFIWLLFLFPITMLVLFSLIGMPFLIGFGVLSYMKYRVKKLEAKINKKDNPVTL